LIEKKSVEPVELSQLFTELENTGVYPESLVETGLKYIRREVDGGKIYFLVNHTSETINEFIPLQTKAKEVVLFDPLTGNYGKAETKIENTVTKVRVNIASGESFFLKTEEETDTKPWKYYETKGDPQEITGTWQLSFEKGGPKLPSDIEISGLKSWTLLGDEFEAFSGSGTYEIHFDIPNVETDNWQLDLGDVRESAQVWINDKFIGAAWSVPFILQTGNLKKGRNTLKVKVTNLAANRIRSKELRGEEWKIFHEINMVDKDYKKFDATKWDPMPSGLLGPVSITPLKE
jgi:hypothetical protein